METAIVCVAVGLAVLYAVRRLLRNLSTKNPPTGCGCECSGDAPCVRPPEDKVGLDQSE